MLLEVGGKYHRIVGTAGLNYKGFEED